MPLSSFHLLYGLRIYVDHPLPGLLVVPAVPDPDVRIHLRRQPASVYSHPVTPAGFFYTSTNLDHRGQPNLQVGLTADGEFFVFLYSDGIRFAIDRTGREVWADWADIHTLEDACTYLVGPVIAFILRLRGVTCLHASAIAMNGRAIAIFGLAGAGKSTTAAAFALRGFSVLSDDVTVLDDRGDCFLVMPGYPRVNLWADSVRVLLGSEDALPRISPTWDKMYLPLDRDEDWFGSKPLPLAAVYVLAERVEKNSAPEIDQMAGSDAMITLVRNTYVNYLLDSEMRVREFDVLSRLLAGVPVRRVRPASDISGIYSLCRTIAADYEQVQQFAAFS